MALAEGTKRVPVNPKLAAINSAAVSSLDRSVIVYLLMEVGWKDSVARKR
jgi:hypothetical protein